MLCSLAYFIRALVCRRKNLTVPNNRSRHHQTPAETGVWMMTTVGGEGTSRFYQEPLRTVYPAAIVSVCAVKSVTSPPERRLQKVDNRIAR